MLQKMQIRDTAVFVLTSLTVSEEKGGGLIPLLPFIKRVREGYGKFTWDALNYLRITGHKKERYGGRRSSQAYCWQPGEASSLWPSSMGVDLDCGTNANKRVYILDLLAA